MKKQGFIERHLISIFAPRTVEVRGQNTMHQNYAIREEKAPTGRYLMRLAYREISIMKRV